MHSESAKRDRALDAIEESIRETLQANDEYLAAWDALWKERIAENFAHLTGSFSPDLRSHLQQSSEQIAEV